MAKILSIYQTAWDSVRIAGNKELYRRKKEQSQKAYEEFLNIRCNTPIVADICMENCFKNSFLLINADEAKTNISKFEALPHIAKLKELGDKRLTELYPNTKEIRAKLIAAHRFAIKKITPKMSFIQKLMLRFK